MEKIIQMKTIVNQSSIFRSKKFPLSFIDFDINHLEEKQYLIPGSHSYAWQVSVLVYFVP